MAAQADLSDITLSTEETKNVENFYTATKNFYYYVTIFGFRPFLLPNERWKIGRFSAIGLVFLIPPLLISGFFIGFLINNLIFIIKVSGFFNGLAVVSLAYLLCLAYLFLYLLLSLRFRSNLKHMVTNLSRLKINRRSLVRLKGDFSVILVICILLHVVLSHMLIKAFMQMKFKPGAWAGPIDYFRGAAIIYIVAVLLYPLVLLGQFVAFLGKVYDEMLEEVRSIPQDEMEDRLPRSYASYISLYKIVEETDRCFSYIAFTAVCISVVNISTCILNIDRLNTVRFGFYGPMEFLMILNFLSYNFLGIWLNDKSRAIQTELHEITPHNPNVYRWIATYYRKATDTSWGMTVGRIGLFERAALLELINAMVTFLALYGQFNPIDPPGTNGTAFDVKAFSKLTR